MTTEELKALGLDEETAGKVFALNGKSVEKHKATAESLRTELEQAKEQLKQMQEAAKAYDGVDVKGLQTQISELKAKYDTDTQSLRRSHALEQALKETHRARDVKSVLPPTNVF